MMFVVGVLFVVFGMRKPLILARVLISIRVL